MAGDCRRGGAEGEQGLERGLGHHHRVPCCPSTEAEYHNIAISNITFFSVQVLNGFIGISQYRIIIFRECASAQWFYKRYLQTLTQISAEKNSTIIFPLPMGRIFVLSFYHKLEEHFKGMVYKRNHI